MSKWEKVKLEDICKSATSSISQKDLIINSGIYPVYGASGLITYIDYYKFAYKYIAIIKDGAGIGRSYILPAKSSIISTLQAILPNNRVNINYFNYALISLHLERTYTGATIPHIYFKDYKKRTIPLPPLEVQHKIASILDTVSEVLKLRKQQLNELDLLVKSRFVEMFGEVGKNPYNFNYISLGSCCKINPKKSKDNRLVSNLKLSFISMSSVSERGYIDTSNICNYDEVKTGFTYFAENDVLFAKITPCMENGKGCIARELINGIGFGSTEFHVLRPIPKKSNPYWLYWLTMFEKFRNDAKQNMTGSAGQRRVPASFLEDYLVALPPIDLQNKFAAFVQHVDELKSEVQKSINETQTLFDSLMQRYFE